MQTRRQLPDNIAELQAILSAQFVAIDALTLDRYAIKVERDTLKESKLDDKEEIKRLKLLLEKFKRMLFGQKSEKLIAQVNQLELEIEELEINQGIRSTILQTKAESPRTVPTRRPLPEHLPRDILEHMPADAACPDCGGAWQKLGEDVSEVLERLPASYRVIRHVRPRLACTCCDRMAQAQAPSRPIARSYFGPGLIGHMIIAKYMDHQPIYRQCQQATREGVELSESTACHVIGGAHHLLRPLMNVLHQYVFASPKLQADDTPIDVLAPGNGKTKQGRLWVYTRDGRPSGDTAAPAVWFRYSPDRKGIHPQTHLKDYSGILQADAYAGYNAVYESDRVLEAACWAHARRKFYDIHVAQPTPITTHVLAQIGELYKIESGIRGSPPECRRVARQDLSKPIVIALFAWLTEQLSTLSRKSVTADAIGYAMNLRQALMRYLDDGIIELDNYAAHAASGMSCIMPRPGLCRLVLASPHSGSTSRDRLAA